MTSPLQPQPQESDLRDKVELILTLLVSAIQKDEIYIARKAPFDIAWDDIMALLASERTAGAIEELKHAKTHNMISHDIVHRTDRRIKTLTAEAEKLTNGMGE
jgi:hypothetical protein